MDDPWNPLLRAQRIQEVEIIKTVDRRHSRERRSPHRRHSRGLRIPSASPPRRFRDRSITPPRVLERRRNGSPRGRYGRRSRSPRRTPSYSPIRSPRRSSKRGSLKRERSEENFHSRGDSRVFHGDEHCSRSNGTLRADLHLVRGLEGRSKPSQRDGSASRNHANSYSSPRRFDSVPSQLSDTLPFSPSNSSNFFPSPSYGPAIPPSGAQYGKGTGLSNPLLQTTCPPLRGPGMPNPLLENTGGAFMENPFQRNFNGGLLPPPFGFVRPLLPVPPQYSQHMLPMPFMNQGMAPRQPSLPGILNGFPAQLNNSRGLLAPPVFFHEMPDPEPIQSTAFPGHPLLSASYQQQYIPPPAPARPPPSNLVVISPQQAPLHSEQSMATDRSQFHPETAPAQGFAGDKPGQHFQYHSGQNATVMHSNQGNGLNHQFQPQTNQGVAQEANVTQGLMQASGQALQASSMSNSALNQYSQQLQVLQGGAFSEVLNPSTSATSSTDSSSISALLLSLISALAKAEDPALIGARNELADVAKMASKEVLKVAAANNVAAAGDIQLVEMEDAFLPRSPIMANAQPMANYSVGSQRLSTMAERIPPKFIGSSTPVPVSFLPVCEQQECKICDETFSASGQFVDHMKSVKHNEAYDKAKRSMCKPGRTPFGGRFLGKAE